MKTVLLTLHVALALAAAASAEPYWIAWEGDDFPENQGWERRYGNQDGLWQGQASRNLVNGVLAIDSLHDESVYDYYRIEDPETLTLDQGEHFVAEWSLVVWQIVGAPTHDPGIAIKSNDAWSVGFGFYPDRVSSVFESDVSMDITPGEFHDYRLISPDMRSYEFFIDNELVRQGTFWNGVASTRVAWGDEVQGAGSLAEWDYFRFGIVPEPSTGVAGIIVALLTGKTR